jgi:hypothetical protein
MIQAHETHTLPKAERFPPGLRRIHLEGAGNFVRAARKYGKSPVNTVFRILITLFVAFLGYEIMVQAFHLLNLPSDRAVFQGMAILALLVILLPVILWRLWRNKQ